MSQPAQLIVSLGSNISPVANLRRAVDLLCARTTVLQVATVWETPPVGTTGPNFYNSAICLLTTADPQTLKDEVLHPLETELGRVRTADKYAPRPIDLDAIVFDDTVLDERLWEYAYLALPIAELCPDLPHPHTHQPLAEIARRLQLTSDAIPHPEVFEQILKNY
jgi:2-amino-4-hydroxy-6-hydroxymethyldihydropteridine diphosphokinase